MPMPLQKPGKSRQDYQTPENFLEAAKKKLGIQDWSIDLAATAENAKAPSYWSPEDNSLIQPWAPYCSSGAWAWLNPPFGDIEPWAEKCFWESRTGAFIAFLTPASCGANWWRDWVHEKAPVLFLNGRLQFVGAEDLYPKDCALILYQPTPVFQVRPWYDIWSWNPPRRKAP